MIIWLFCGFGGQGAESAIWRVGGVEAWASYTTKPLTLQQTALSWAWLPGSLWAWPPPCLQAQLGEAAAGSKDKWGAGPGAASSASWSVRNWVANAYSLVVFNSPRRELPIALLSFQEGGGREPRRLAQWQPSCPQYRARPGGPGLPASAPSGGDRLYRPELVLTTSAESHFWRKAWPRGLSRHTSPNTLM